MKIKINETLITHLCPKQLEYERENVERKEKEMNRLKAKYESFIERMGNLFHVKYDDNRLFDQIIEIFDTAHVDKYLSRALP